MRKILISGATSDIGIDVINYLKDENELVLTGRKFDKIKDLLSGNSYQFWNLDFEKDLDKISNKIKESCKEKSFDGFISLAGYQQTKSINAIKYSDFEKTFKINFYSNLEILKSISKYNKNTFSAVLISSILSSFSTKGTALYSASKSALDSLVKSASIEYSRKGIRVNSILLGHVKTKMLTESTFTSNEYFKKLEDKYPLGLGDTDDVIYLIEYLLSEKSKWMTGNNIYLDGGAHHNFL